METKLCSKCGNDLPLSAFYQRTGAKSHHSACKVCEREMAKDWYERNKDKATSKVKEWRQQNSDAVKQYRIDNRQKHYRQELVRKYGVEATWFDEQIRQQGDSCVCCKREFQWGDKQTSPHVDHCHETKAVRGILCNRCNTVLGLCKDDDKLLSSLARYLRKCHG
jgi:hypothetical protein